MTYDDAMNLINQGVMMRRAGWNPYMAVSLMEDDHDGSGWVRDEYGEGVQWEGGWITVRWELDNSEGMPTGTWGIYDPTEEDLAATDWEEYDAVKLGREHGA